MDITLTKQQIRDAAQQAYNYGAKLTGGANADYIPYLANIDPTLFGLSVMLPDGTAINLGDTDYKFGIESVSKVPTAILAMRQQSPAAVLDKIGADATGLPFNSIFAILLENDHPSTPLVNAGAISACSMVAPKGDSDAKWKAITDNITDLCGSAPELIDELYKSESATNFNNHAITWLLKNYDRIYDDPDMSLDLYTRQCSLGITSAQLAVMAATIAAGGVNPLTGKQVFAREITAENNHPYGHGRFLPAFGRLAIYIRHTGQKRCRRCSAGGAPRHTGNRGFRPASRRCRQLRQSTGRSEGIHPHSRTGGDERRPRDNYRLTRPMQGSESTPRTTTLKTI